MNLAYNSGRHMTRLCRMDGKSMVSHKDEVVIGRKLKRSDWKGKQQLPSGWSFKISRRLRRADWKERQELLAGWSFRGIRRLKKFDWKLKEGFLAGWSFKISF
jgi:uncharacterized protein YbdZ (MbtH family)